MNLVFIVRVSLCDSACPAKPFRRSLVAKSQLRPPSGFFLRNISSIDRCGSLPGDLR